jgi:hypothetical protein
MTSPDDRWRREPDARDVVESSPRSWPPSGRLVAILIAVALLAGLGAGYAAGARHGAARAAASRSSRSAAAASAAIAIPGGIAGQQGGLCSAQVGRELQLGVQITNQSAQRLVIQKAWPVLPLGGLQAVAHSWEPCGAWPAADSAATVAGNVLPAGGSTWYTVTFKVLVPCPGALPVQFGVTFGPPGRADGGARLVITSRLPGFVDLGGVPYAGCHVG